MGFEPIAASLSEEVPGYARVFVDKKQDENPAETARSLTAVIRWFQERAIPLQ